MHIGGKAQSTIFAVSLRNLQPQLPQSCQMNHLLNPVCKIADINWLGEGVKSQY